MNGGSTVTHGHDADGLLTIAATATATLSVHQQAVTGPLDSTTVGAGRAGCGARIDATATGC